MSVVRRRQPDDLDACVAALAAVHEADAYPTSWPSDPVRWLTPGGMVDGWVAVDGSTVAGHLLLCRTGDGRLEISRLFVVPSARGGGIARGLLSVARAAVGDEPLSLDVADHNRSAVALYERTGWRRLDSYRADWLDPDGRPALVHRFTLDRKGSLQN
ncbi:MAG TPA: GNAT family N-acetyltransferase [Micromonosporaceae bacterium]|jgi:ribosomal protein S18 acetylase RimI-like enzyme